MDKYPLYFITRRGCYFKRHPADLSADGTPRYIPNPKTPNNTYSLQICLKDYFPVYKMAKTHPLNKNYSFVFCSKDEPGALNGFTFEAKKEWVLFKDLGERYSESSRYRHTTEYSIKEKLYFDCSNPKAAIQYALIHAGKGKKLTDIYFKILDV